MALWLPFLMVGLILLVANIAGWLDLNSNPLSRFLKRLIISVWIGALPFFWTFFFRNSLKQEWKDLWMQLTVLVFLGTFFWDGLKWIWKYYGPVSEGHRRCPCCHNPILKVMLECPHCRKSIEP